MLIFLAELIDVQSGEYNSLIFRSQKYDFGLKKMVECSQSVGISQECLSFLENYKKNIGQIIAVGVSAIKSKNDRIFFMCQTDILDINDLILDINDL